MPTKRGMSMSSVTGVILTEIAAIRECWAEDHEVELSGRR